MSKCKQCGLRIKQVGPQWVHTDDGDFRHEAIPTGFVPGPVKKHFKQPPATRPPVPTAYMQSAPPVKKHGATGAAYVQLKNDRKNRNRGRLPDKSTFLVSFDAASCTWSGTLAVNGLKFVGKMPGVFKLLEELDGGYRKFVQATEFAEREAKRAPKRPVRHIVAAKAANTENESVMPSKTMSTSTQKNPPTAEADSGFQA